MRHGIFFALLCCAPSLAAQPAVRTIAPGMSRAQVVATLGIPSTMRSVGDHSYLFYRNECGRRCGMNDLVVLRRDSVVDAIFRSRRRAYSGTSSSPAAIPPEKAAASRPAQASPPARMTPVPANDVRPSIPLDAPPSRSAPAPAPPKKTP